MGGGSSGIDSAGTGGPGEVGDMGMPDACGRGCAVKPASSEFAFAPPNGNDFFPPLGLFPKPNRAPRERIEGRPDPPFPLLPCESPEWPVDAVLGENDFFLPTRLAAGESRG